MKLLFGSTHILIKTTLENYQLYYYYSANWELSTDGVEKVPQWHTFWKAREDGLCFEELTAAWSDKTNGGWKKEV